MNLHKKWHLKLTRLQQALVEMAEELPITRGEVEVLCDRIYNLQKTLVAEMKGSNAEKREHIIGLALSNGTLSMAAIARHVGCSEALVAKVFSERHRWDKRCPRSSGG